MRKLLYSAILMVCTYGLQAQNLPDTQIKDLNSGSNVAFNETVTKGKVTVISFWATWCIPCKKEIKSINKKLDGWHKEADFNYMTVSIDKVEAEGLARSYGLSQGWKFPFYIDENSDLTRSLNFQNVPFTLIIDKTGAVVFRHSGYEEGGEEEIWAKVKELVAAK